MLSLVVLFLLFISTLTDAQVAPKGFTISLIHFFANNLINIYFLGVFDNLLESSTSLIRNHCQVGEVKQALSRKRWHENFNIYFQKPNNSVNTADSQLFHLQQPLPGSSN